MSVRVCVCACVHHTLQETVRTIKLLALLTTGHPKAALNKVGFFFTAVQTGEFLFLTPIGAICTYLKLPTGKQVPGGRRGKKVSSSIQKQDVTKRIEKPFGKIDALTSGGVIRHV